MIYNGEICYDNTVETTLDDHTNTLRWHLLSHAHLSLSFLSLLIRSFLSSFSLPLSLESSLLSKLSLSVTSLLAYTTLVLYTSFTLFSQSHTTPFLDKAEMHMICATTVWDQRIRHTMMRPDLSFLLDDSCGTVQLIAFWWFSTLSLHNGCCVQTVHITNGERKKK